MPPVTINGDTGIVTPMYNGSITANAVTPSVNMKNRIINGNMVISQRNGTTATTTADDYPVDRFQIANVSAATFSAVQSTTAPAGFNNSFYFNVTAADSSVTGSDRTFIRQRIEGYNIADLGFGTASAKTITLSAWVYSSVTGTFGGAILNNAEDRSYAFTYSIASANTWTQISVTIAGDTSGTWLTTNGRGMNVLFSLGMGSSLTTAAGSWTAGQFYSANGCTNLISTNGANFYITGVQLEVGSTATSFDYRPYGTELNLCQRYYAKMSTGGYSNYTAFASGLVTGSISGNLFVKYPVTMRASATIAYSNVAYAYAAGSTTAISSVGSTYAGTDSMLAQPNATGASMTIGYACTLQANNNSAGYIELSAEL